jgi:hypothetical protein
VFFILTDVLPLQPKASYRYSRGSAEKIQEITTHKHEKHTKIVTRNEKSEY